MRTLAPSPALQDLAGRLWDERDRGVLVMDGAWQARRLYVAIYSDLTEREGYDPDQDLRVAWMKEMISGIRQGQKRPKAAEVMEEWVKYMLGNNL
jgi:hypothetical protein